MSFVADLHIHSRYSQACSRDLNLENLALWAKYKGVDLVGTGDCLHPLWQEELKTKLKVVHGGFYQYQGISFAVTDEVSCIYKENNKGFRIHILLIFPGIESSFALSKELIKRGINLKFDGRPILNFSVKALCELVWGIDQRIIIIPAHIWTPWFGMFGSKSGYNSMEDCFGEFKGQIYAVETGLSSEPAMNWRVGDLDQKTIISFSDLHSLPRLAREVTVFEGECSFAGLVDNLKNQKIVETIEFFPEEGKYHYSGHRNCNVVFSPEGLRKNGVICPVCHKKLTVGVLQRVEDLSKRSTASLKLEIHNGVVKSEAFPHRPGFRMLVQLEEIISQAFSVGVKSKKVESEYHKLVAKFAPELNILTSVKISDIENIAGEKIAEGIKRVRNGNLKISPGFDNTYGKVSIW